MAQVFRTSAWGLSRAERHGFESQSTSYFLSLPFSYLELKEFALLLCLLVLRTDHWSMKTARKQKKRLAITNKSSTLEI